MNTITGLTLKQFARAEFWAALGAYRQALATNQDIIKASVRVHAALSGEGVPKRFKAFVNAAYRDYNPQRL